MEFKKRKKKDPNWIPKPISQRQIEWASDQYLQRFVATETQLRRVLQRRLQKNWRARGTEVTEEERLKGQELVEAQMQKVMEAGRIKDAEVARLWVETWVNRGKTVLYMRQKLQEKGVAPQIVSEMIEEIRSQQQNPDLEAAITCARKKKFGPYHANPMKQAERKQRDIAAMMRAGHRYDLIKCILECSTIEEVEALLDE